MRVNRGDQHPQSQDSYQNRIPESLLDPELKRNKGQGARPKVFANEKVSFSINQRGKIKGGTQHFAELSHVTQRVSDFNTVDDTEIINEKLYAAGIETIPRSSGIFKHRPVPQWSYAIGILHRATRQALPCLRQQRHD